MTTPPARAAAPAILENAPAALAALPLASALLDRKLAVLAANRRFVRLVGSRALARPDGAGLSDLLVLDEDDESEAPGLSLAAKLRALGGGQSLAHEIVVRSAAHEAQPVRAHFVSLAGSPAFVEFSQAAFLLQLESAAAPLAGCSATASQPLAWYRALFLESVLPKLLLDERFRVVDANDAFLQMTGYALPALLWTDPAGLVADEAAGERLARERAAAREAVDIVREAMAYPVRCADGSVELVDAIVARATEEQGAALQVATVVARVDEAESGDEQAARWRERFVASLRDECRMLPVQALGTAVVTDGRIVRMSARFAGFFGFAPDATDIPLERMAGAKTARAIEQAALAFDDAQPDPYASLPTVEFVWTSSQGLPASFVAMARPTGEPESVLLTVVDTSGRDADIAARLAELAQSRDALLRQVHHQVANNLDGLAALVQAESQWQPQAQEALERVASRLRVAAHIEGLAPQDYAQAAQPIAALVEGVAGALARHFEVPIACSTQQALAAPARWVAKSERLAVALACNELVTNAVKHRADAQAPVRVSVEVAENEARIEVRNAGRIAPAREQAAGARAPQGVALLRRLLPAQGARFSLEQDGDDVVGRITLSPPVLY